MAPTATIEIEAAVKGDAAQAGLFGPEDIPFGRRSGPVAGIDEAGRGCLAGPVVAAAVILQQYLDTLRNQT